MAEASNRVKCPKCQRVNPPGQRQCTGCGAPLVKASVSAAHTRPSQPEQSAAPPPNRPDMRQIFFSRGQVVADRYTILDMIGRGGMGCIYRVQDNTLKEEVALKTLLPQFVRDKLVVERFYNEARIARGLSHPGIVRVHDIGMAGNILYISMEYLQGQSLRAVLDRLPPGERLNPKTALRIFDELCAALEYAHMYTVHRDIKPENVMIAKDGVVKLMDFGISKLVTNTRMTATSVVMGTPHYMSPEQLKDSGSVDARADVYSMGVLIYEVMTGNVPTGVPKPVSQVMRDMPPLMDDIVAKCLEPNPDERYQSITDLRRELQRVCDMMNAAEKTASLEEGPGLGKKLAAALLILLIAGAAAAGVWMMEQRWKNAPATVANQPATAAAPGIAAVEGPSPGERYERMADLTQQARQRMQSRSSDEGGAKLMELAADYTTQARAAAEGGDLAAAADLQWKALQCAAGPLLQAEADGMVFVPPGEVTLFDRSGATYTVAVDGFLVDQTEVTNGAYRQFVEESEGGWRLPAGVGGPDVPVVNVTLYDAMAYAAHFGKRLPTEAQWARAAYGVLPPDSLYPWGAEWQANAAHVGGSASAAPVGSYEDDVAFGVADLAGNVSEWTATSYGPLPYENRDSRNDVASFEFGDPMTVMGGNFTFQPIPLHSRWSEPYGSRRPYIGFRCVQPVPSDLDELAKRIAG